MNTRFLFMTSAAALLLAATFAACNNDDGTEDDTTPVAVTGLSIGHPWPTISLEAGDVFTLTAAVVPAEAADPGIEWKSSATATATVSGGTVTGVAPGTVTITATSTDGGKTDSRVFTVVAVPEATSLEDSEPGWGTTLGTVGFATDETWNIGGLTWSDVVTATGCDKATYASGSSPNFKADGRHLKGVPYMEYIDTAPYSVEHTADYDGTLFSWAAVHRFRKQLCPDGWRVPTKDDFVALDNALGGTGTARPAEAAVLAKYLGSDWGAQLTGFCLGSGAFSLPDGDNANTVAYFWSITNVNGTNAGSLLIGKAMDTAGDWETKDMIDPGYSAMKNRGHLVRCVR